MSDELSSNDSFRDESSVSERDSIDKDDVIGQLLWNLSASSLLELKQFFHKLDTASADAPNLSSPKHREKRTLYIGCKDFQSAVESVFGDSELNKKSIQVFQALDHDKSGFIWWEQLLDNLIECGEKRTAKNLEGWIPVKTEKIKIMDLMHCKRESIAFVVPIETESSFCYVIISKFGKVGVYDGKLKLLTEYDVFFTRTGISRRVRDIWITAAINLEDSKSLVMTASDRSIMIYDSSTLCHVPTFLISGIPNIPTYLAYNPSRDKSNSSWLMMGDDHGGISIITFKQPRVGLFLKQIQEKINNLLWIDLQCILQEPFCEIKVHRRIHTRPVRRIFYIKVSDSIISCSSDPQASLVIRHKKGIRDPYIFKVNRGISCFFYSSSLRVLATGSSDGRLRLWSPTTPGRPVATLPKDPCPILDVIILAHITAAVTFNKKGEMKIWDILNEVCIQSLHIMFPSFGILGRLILFGTHCIFTGPGRKKTGESKPPSSAPNKVTDPLVDSAVAKKLGSEEYLDSWLQEDTHDSGYERDVTEEKSTEHSQWNRPEILITCCNHIATVPIQEPPITKSQRSSEETIKDEHQPSILPPPQRSSRPRRPSIWDDNQFADSKTKDPGDAGNKKTTTRGQILNLRHLTSPNAEENREHKYRPITEADNDLSLDELLARSGLSGIFERDFIGKFGYKHDINSKMAIQKSREQKMRYQVAQGAPYSALELPEPQEIKFSTRLPLSLRMQKRSGLLYFTEPQQILKHNSCFSLSTPRTTYSVSSKNSNNSRKSNSSILPSSK